MKTLILCTNVTEYTHAYELKLSDVTYVCLDLGSFFSASQDGVKQVDWFGYVGNESVHISSVINKKVQRWARYISAQTDLLDSEANYIESVIFPLLAMVVFDFFFIRKLLSNVEAERLLVFQQKQETIFGNSWQLGGGFYGLTVAAETCARTYGLEFRLLSARPFRFFREPVKRMLVVTRDIARKGKRIIDVSRAFSSKEKHLINDAGRKRLFVVAKTRLNEVQRNTLVNCLRGPDVEIVDLPVLEKHRNTFGGAWCEGRLKRKLRENARIVFQSEGLSGIVWSDQLAALFSSTLDKVLSSIDRISYRQQQLRTLAPACVVTGDPEIAHAAFRESIQCVNLPHSGIVDPISLPPLPGVNLTSGLLQEDYNRSTSDIDHVVQRIGVPHLDLPTVNSLGAVGQGRRLLVLAKNMGRRRWETDDYRAYLAALDVMAKVCVTECWALTIKLHPSGGRPMLSALTKWRDVKETESNIQVAIEIDKSLNEVASRHDIVVGCQDSTAIAEVLWMSKPVVFIDYFSNRAQREKYSNNWLRKRLATVANAEQLEEIVSRLMTDDVYRKRYTAKCQALASDICIQFGDQAIQNLARVALEVAPR